MLSGVGPAEALAPLGIERPPRACPVGQNLQDHVMLNFVCLTDKGSLISSRHARGVRALTRPRAAGRSPPTAARAAPSSAPRDGLEAPDVQFHIGCLLLHEEFLGVPFDDAYTFGPAVVKPTSRGQVTLRSPLPARAAADRPQLPEDRGGPREHDRRRAAELRDRRARRR